MTDREVGDLWRAHSFEHNQGNQCAIKNGECAVIILIRKLVKEREATSKAQINYWQIDGRTQRKITQQALSDFGISEEEWREGNG